MSDDLQVKYKYMYPNYKLRDRGATNFWTDLNS